MSFPQSKYPLPPGISQYLPPLRTVPYRLLQAQQATSYSYLAGLGALLPLNVDDLLKLEIGGVGSQKSSGG